MTHRNRTQGAWAAGLAALALAGCGGGGGGGGGVDPPTSDPSPYAGTWTQSAASGPAGTTLTINAAGQVTGTLTPDPGTAAGGAAEISGAVTGTIATNGALSVSRVESGGTTETAAGTLTLDARGHLVGTLQEDDAPTPGPPGTSTPAWVAALGAVPLDLARQP